MRKLHGGNGQHPCSSWTSTPAWRWHSQHVASSAYSWQPLRCNNSSRFALKLLCVNCKLARIKKKQPFSSSIQHSLLAYKVREPIDNVTLATKPHHWIAIHFLCVPTVHPTMFALGCHSASVWPTIVRSGNVSGKSRATDIHCVQSSLRADALQMKDARLTDGVCLWQRFRANLLSALAFDKFRRRSSWSFFMLVLGMLVGEL